MSLPICYNAGAQLVLKAHIKSLIVVVNAFFAMLNARDWLGRSQGPYLYERNPANMIRLTNVISIGHPSQGGASITNSALSPSGYAIAEADTELREVKTGDLAGELVSYEVT